METKLTTTKERFLSNVEKALEFVLVNPITFAHCLN